MIQRKLLNELITWKNQPLRKPVLIDGARQTGKTYLLQHLFGAMFPRVLRIDFLEQPIFKQAFEGGLSPDEILTNLELITNQPFDRTRDLLILDEIGECGRAVTSLKYFAEQAPNCYVTASGSNIGLLTSFPVGKVQQYNCRPLTFQEFLFASNEDIIIRAFEQQLQSDVAHHQLMDRLTDYFFTGGMPEAVSVWYTKNSLLDRIHAVSEVHNNLIEGYRRDFGKYGYKADANVIEAVFNSIPSQLSSVLDDSVKRFKFKNVHERKSRYNDFENAILWLKRCRLALANYPISGTPHYPLGAHHKENIQKLFLFDTGILNHMLGTTYRQIKQQNYAYKGYVAENFAQQELVALGFDPTFSWHDARAEIEFLVQAEDGEIVPIEVKSGKRTRARSLDSYRTKCRPSKTLKLTGTQGSGALEKIDIVLPLYFIHHLPSKL
jgi:predicted AAA+ superfamily ATPase